MGLEILERTAKKSIGIEFYKPTLSKEDLKSVLECLVEEKLSSGLIVERFEKIISSTFKAKHTSTSNNLTSAYHLSMIGLGIGDGDKVLLSTLAPLEALDAIYLVGATPIPVDIGRKSFLPDVEKLNQLIEKENPKLFILDHPFGGIHSASRYQLGSTMVLEDITEALGWGDTTVPVGKQGHVAVCGLSFENTITTGSGAFILTEDSNIHKTIEEKKSRNLRKPGIAKLDCNLIDYQAALGIEQIGKLGVLVERKRKIAHVYLQSVSQTLEIESYFANPEEDSFSRFPIIIPKLSYEEANRYFKSLQVGTHRIHEQPIHKILELEASEFPNAERMFQKGHCLPIYPNLTKDNIQRIATSLRRIY